MSSVKAASPPPPSTPASPPSGKASSESKSIRVFLRARPLMDRELTEKHTASNLVIEDATTVSVTKPAESSGAMTRKTFKFHGVFGAQATQEQVYAATAKDAVDSAMDGYHGVMFAYGQTGSGKTFTVAESTPGREGILPRALQEVWRRINADTDHEYTCTVSFVQLYNEILMNLLEEGDRHVKIVGVLDRRTNLKLQDDITSQPIDVTVSDYASTMKLFELGSSRKEISSTKMNKASSRSHTIFTLTVHKSSPLTGPASGDGAEAKALEGKLILCDLAGSERVKKTEAIGTQLGEATFINNSLLTLGRVVQALTDKKGAQHAPFRESKLTRILQYSLSGFGKTTIIVNVSSSDMNTDETLGAIAFGQRAIQIQQNAQRHETVDYKKEFMDLQANFDAKFDKVLTEMLADQKKMMDSQLAAKDEVIALLEQQNALLAAQLAKATSVGQPTPAGAKHTDPAAAATGPKAAAGTGGGAAIDIDEFVRETRKRLADAEARVIEAERTAVAEKQKADAADFKLFSVSSRFQSFRASALTDFGALRAAYTEALAELNALKGTEYLNSNIDLQLSQPEAGEMDGSKPRPTMDVAGGSSAAAAAAGGDIALQQALDEAQERIRMLLDERNSLVLYQHSATRAIKMLHQDRETIALQLKSLLSHRTSA